jgi:hypothetical protein
MRQVKGEVTVKAVRYDEFGGIDVLRVDEEAGAGAGGFSPGDKVIGFTNNRASRARPSSSPEPPAGSARSPSSSRAVPEPRSSAWRARAITSG